VTDESFARDVVGSPLPVLVDYWAEWCPPCHMIAPVLDEMATEYAGRLTVAKLNTDENPRTVAAHHVLANPTLQVYRDGKVVGQIVGARSKRALKEFIDASIA
jgi:thioredoxin 1